MADAHDPMRGLIGHERPMGRFIHAGSDDEIFKWSGCPDCGGRGYFVVNPFAPYGMKYRQCVTCETAFRAAASSAGAAGVSPNRQEPISGQVLMAPGQKGKAP
jgi:hypothetical protein